MSQVLLGMAFLHSKNHVHGDIKARYRVGTMCFVAGATTLVHFDQLLPPLFILLVTFCSRLMVMSNLEAQDLL